VFFTKSKKYKSSAQVPYSCNVPGSRNRPTHSRCYKEATLNEKLCSHLPSPEYYHMVTIPSGARSIHIHETNMSTSYISVRNTLKRYYLNGHWTVDWPGRYKFSGTAFNYRRSFKEPESLTSPGPTNETLFVEVEASPFGSRVWVW
jgi:hypothetical protein